MMNLQSTSRYSAQAMFNAFVLSALILCGCMQFRISDEKAHARFTNEGVRLKTSFMRVNNRNIHYASTGHDSLPTILFVHGSPGSWNAFIDYLANKELLQHYRMLSVDRPGFGYSDFGKAEHLDVQSQLLSPLLQEIKNGKPIYLVGHSLGGPMIVKMAADNPGMIDALVILSGSLDPDEELSENWRQALDKTPLYYFVPGSFRPSNRELMYFKDDVMELADDFAKVKCRVYLVHGDRDDMVPPGNVEYAMKKFVNAKSVDTIIFKGANHFIPWSREKEIRELLLKLKENE